MRCRDFDPFRRLQFGNWLVFSWLFPPFMISARFSWGPNPVPTP